MKLTTPPLTEPRAILVRTPNWLGDLMMSTAFLGALLDRFPDVPVHLIVRKGFEGLPLPRRGEVLPFHKAGMRAGVFGAGLRGRGYSHMFVLPPSLSAAWMAFRSGIPWRIGYRGQGRRLLLRPAMTHNHPHRTRHLAQEYLDLLAPWGDFAPEAHPLRLEVGPAFLERHLPAPLRDAPPYVVLAPGAEYGPAKMWPEAHYRESARQLAGAGWPVVVAGLPQDRPAGEAILAGLPTGRNLAGETDLNGLVALLAGSALLISNDSGAMHVAAALGRPQIALFGSTNATWTGPRNPLAAVLSRNEPCAPCYRRTCPLGHLNCLNELAPAQVVERALEMLKASRPGS